MPESSERPAEVTESEDKPKYEAPRVLPLGNTLEGQGGNLTGCATGSAANGCFSGGLAGLTCGTGGQFV